MDISKLPKLSKTDPPPPPLDPPPPPSYQLPAAPGIGPDVWFNACIAAILLYFGRAFFLYFLGRITGHPYHTWMNYGEGTPEIPYPELPGFQMLSDAGVFAFGATVLFEAIIKAYFGLRRTLPRLLIYFALFLTIASTIYNIFIVFKLTSDYGLPLISALAVAFGGFIVYDLFTLLKLTRPR
jgi:hypothetical protein